MTVEAFSPTPPYVIAGAGPYAIEFPYFDASDLVVRAREIIGGAEVLTPLVLGVDYVVAPVQAGPRQGALTLVAGTATTHAGRQLTIRRRTRIEQGWQGKTAREKGLELQLDRLAMAVQDAGFAAPIVIPGGNCPDLHLAEDFEVFGSDSPETMINEGAGLQLALTTACATGRRLIVPARHYLTNQALTETRDVEIIGTGGKPRIWGTPALAAGAGNIMGISGPSAGPEANWIVSEDILPGQRKIKLGSVNLLMPGMVVCLRTDKLWSYDHRSRWIQGETQLIQAVDPLTNEVTFRGVTRDRYLLADNPRLNVGRQLRVHLENLAFEFQEGVIGSVCLRLTRAGAELRDIAARMAGFAGISIQRSFGVRVEGLETERVGGYEGDGYVGYGISVISSGNIDVDYHRSRECRRAFDANGGTTSGPSRDINYTRFYIEGGGRGAFGEDRFVPDGTMPNYGTGMHGGCEGMRIAGGKTVGVENPFTVRGLDTVIENNVVIGAGAEVVYATYGEGLVFRGNTIQSMQGSRPLLTPPAPAPVCLVRFGAGTAESIRWKYERPTSIVDNVVNGMIDALVILENQPTIGNIAIRRNEVFTANGSGNAALIKAITTPAEVLNGFLELDMQRQYSLGTIGLLGENVSLGVSSGLDNVVALGGGRFVLSIPNGERKLIRLAQAGVLSGFPVRVVIQANDTSIACDFQLLESGASTSMGLIGGEVAVQPGATFVPAEGKLTVGVTSSALILENRRGNVRALIVTLS